jgi:hypothetical protein
LEGEKMKRESYLRACGAALGLVIGVATLGAQFNANRLEYLTFSAPVALPGVVLAPGKYAFEIADAMGTSSVVRVSTAGTREPRFLGLTWPVNRPLDTTNAAHVSLGEARRGEAVPILAWYPMYDSLGRQFIYR